MIDDNVSDVPPSAKFIFSIGDFDDFAITDGEDVVYPLIPIIDKLELHNHEKIVEIFRPELYAKGEDYPDRYEFTLCLTRAQLVYILQTVRPLN